MAFLKIACFSLLLLEGGSALGACWNPRGCEKTPMTLSAKELADLWASIGNADPTAIAWVEKIGEPTVVTGPATCTNVQGRLTPVAPACYSYLWADNRAGRFSMYFQAEVLNEPRKIIWAYWPDSLSQSSYPLQKPAPLPGLTSKLPPRPSTGDKAELEMGLKHPEWKSILASKAFDAWLRTMPTDYERRCRSTSEVLVATACIDEFLKPAPSQ